MATRSLIDTNILVYRYDPRFPDKQSIAEDVLRDGIASGGARLAHQALVEFVAAATRGGPESWLLEPSEARREAEELMAQFPVIYPNDAVLRTALRGAAAYGMSWFDAHMWAYAEVHGLEELVSEDFQHGRLYGIVTVTNPFASTAG
ncbi:MAG: PIN domain-containing protein [Gammaproteobacteria bacterium]|nr:PIN domain-containing protein [Gammaproteobacteria bacterium]